MKRRNDFLIGPREKAIEAIKTGKTEEALKYLNDVYEQCHALHDGYCNSMSLFQGILAMVKGVKWFKTLTRTRIFEAYRPKFERWKDMSPEQRVEEICNMHRGHYSEFHVEEDDERFIVAITGCNAGGRLIRDGIAKRQNALTEKAYPWSFNRAGFPYYCVHAYFFNELWRELGIKVEIQWGKQYDDKGNPIEEPCKYIIYK